MKVDSISKTPFYTKQQVKSEAKAAATSAVLSAGLTLALNRGKDFKRAGMVGGIAAGISLMIGAVHRLISMSKEKAEVKSEMAKTALNTHQG